MRRYWAGAAGLILVTFAVHLGCIDEDTTEFGNPNGLDRKNLPGEAGITPVLCEGSDGGLVGCPTFEKDIYPYMTATGKWRCGDVACHGGTSSPSIPCDEPGKCFDALAAVVVEGKPYILPDAGNVDPSARRMLCSLQGGCGSRMPKPPGLDLTPGELCIVDAWLKCGSPR